MYAPHKWHSFTSSQQIYVCMVYLDWASLIDRLRRLWFANKIKSALFKFDCFSYVEIAVEMYYIYWASLSNIHHRTHCTTHRLFTWICHETRLAGETDWRMPYHTARKSIYSICDGDKWFSNPKKQQEIKDSTYSTMNKYPNQEML